MSYYSLPRFLPCERKHVARNGGFALVIALSLMAFVLLLILTISTLVQVEQQRSGSQKERLKAEQAALLSLNMAIGKLQQTAGLDQRVTAPAQSVANVNGVKQLTGVWRSWEGLDHQVNGLPIAPDYTSKLETGVLDIDSSDTGRFLGWLVSSAYDSSSSVTYDASTPPDLTEEFGITRELVGSGSVGDNVEDEVHVVPTEIDDGDTAIAWWISGENTKVLLSERELPDDKLGWSELLSSSTIPNSSEFDITDSAGIDRVLDRQTLNLLQNSVVGDNSLSQTNFHDLTGYARGLLTNTANGGWRRDLSLMSEAWETLSAPSGSTDVFPFFTLSPGIETEALKDSGELGGLIYPWAEEGWFVVANGKNSGGASMGWGGLVDFATKYQDIVSGSSSGDITFDPIEGNRRDSLILRPVLARVHWVLSFKSKLASNGSDYDAYVNVNPVLTYWNPYNVSLTGVDAFSLELKAQLPYSMKFQVGSDSNTTTYELDSLVAKIPEDTEVWQPGEARVYSVESKSNLNLVMQKGYPENIGADFALGLTGAADDEFTVTLVTQSGNSNTFGNEISFEFQELNSAGERFNLNTNILASYADVEQYWSDPTITNTTMTMIKAVDGTVLSPFMIMMVQLQNITEYAVGSRGYSQKKPIFAHVSSRYKIESDMVLANTGLDVCPFDVVMLYPNAGATTDTGLPADEVTAGSIATSYRLADGLTGLVAAEIPTRPLRSIGELQHFDVGFYSAVAPYVANPIGNSTASFIIEPDAVYSDVDISESLRGSYDHSYVSNHLFFDDWFVSSIAPETNGYSSSEIRSAEDVYRDFVSGEEDLPNQAYVPAEILASADATGAASDLLADDAAWYSVASKLEVEGMFNINSTSVPAWSALLKHLRNADVSYISNVVGGSTWSLEADTGNDDHPVSRTTIAGDPAANATNNPTDSYSELGTHARLTDLQIEALATGIVEQVKQRGPFLSLSEFVNRQLNASDESLSLSGTIESALVELSENGVGSDENPYSALQSTFGDQVVVPSGLEHDFPAAAEGYLAYGFPGWIRQADILRPLAPVLSARDDTFIIRAYGESRDSVTGEVKSEAWCEAIVQRQADYVDADVDDSSVLPSDSTLNSEINKRMGRRFSIVSFRWLAPDEV
jgi:hypothetical protein